MQVSTSSEELRKLIRESVHEALFAAGLRIDEEEHVEDARRDFMFLRRMREASEGISSKVGMAVILAVFSALGVMLSNGFHFWASK